MEVGTKCILCQMKIKKKNIQANISDLSFEGLEPMKSPFNSVKINSFRLITIKQRQRKLKRWGALFSGFTTKPIHFEAVESYDTNSFIGNL